MSEALVLYDEDCPVCRQLAAFGERRAPPRVRFLGWQTWAPSAEAAGVLPDEALRRGATELRVVAAGQLLEGTDAWSFLLQVHPDLKGLNWLAARLGLTRQAAAAVKTGGSLVRRLCWSCPKPPPWERHGERERQG